MVPFYLSYIIVLVDGGIILSPILSFVVLSTL